MNWEQLLELAEMLANPPGHGETRGRPQQTHLRKAISAAYYAMFHALANSNADTLVVHQFWIDGYRDFNLMRASAVVKRQSTRIASWLR